MSRIFSMRTSKGVALYGLLDVRCVGAGMGVPIIAFFWAPVGWYLAMRITRRFFDLQSVLRRVMAGAALTSALTGVGMLLIWGPTLTKLFDPAADLANFGIPLILYEPRASFIGWLVLMIVISPFLQFLMTLLGAHLTLAWLKNPLSRMIIGFPFAPKVGEV